MAAGVPNLGGTFFVTDPQSVIAYTIQRFFRTPGDTIPMFSDQVISLPSLVSQFAREPSVLADNIRSDLQNCLDRIFNGERQIVVSCDYQSADNVVTDYTISVTYTKINGDLDQVGITVGLKNGRLIIPENSLDWLKQAV